MRLDGSEEVRTFEERRPYHPEFGLEVETTRLCWSTTADAPLEVRIEWEAR